MKLSVQGIQSSFVRSIRDGGSDANGQPAQHRYAEGLANPCRHCLELINDGDEMLILSYRPFQSLQPYAETGPIFLHKNGCQHYKKSTIPAWFSFLEPAIIRGYDENSWIRYDTGDVVPGKTLTEKCCEILSDQSIAYVHIRSKFNCFQCQVERA